MHPFTLVTKTYLQCLLYESNKAYKKCPETPERSKYEESMSIKNQK